MQIFLPSLFKNKSAQELDDLRLNKQIIELCQILSTCIWIESCDKAENLYPQYIYLPTHENHPLVKWCRYSYYNYTYSCDFLLKCLREYEYRFDKLHGCERLCNTFFHFDYLFILKTGEHRILNCTTNHKHIEDVHEAYRECLKEKWNKQNRILKWTKRQIPEWYKEKNEYSN